MYSLWGKNKLNIRSYHLRIIQQRILSTAQWKLKMAHLADSKITSVTSVSGLFLLAGTLRSSRIHLSLVSSMVRNTTCLENLSPSLCLSSGYSWSFLRPLFNLLAGLGFRLEASHRSWRGFLLFTWFASSYSLVGCVAFGVHLVATFWALCSRWKFLRGGSPWVPREWVFPLGWRGGRLRVQLGMTYPQFTVSKLQVVIPTYIVSSFLHKSKVTSGL